MEVDELEGVSRTDLLFSYPFLSARILYSSPAVSAMSWVVDPVVAESIGWLATASSFALYLAPMYDIIATRTLMITIIIIIINIVIFHIIMPCNA